MNTATTATKKSGKKATPASVLDLRYSLAELPTSQHRAGLAGLVLMVDWMHLQPDVPNGAVCEIVTRSTRGAHLRIDERGLAWLFDIAYAARNEEVAYGAPFKKKGQVITPSRTREMVEKDAKGKEKKRTLYFYPVTIPRGAFIPAWDPTFDGQDGLWYKLWRDMLWQIVRGVPAQRTPYDDRANGRPNRDAHKLFALLSKPNATVDQPSTYLLGAQAMTPDNVAFQDQARFQLLLHFWPFVAQIYKPFTYDREGKRIDQGYAIAVPDVADLDLFCEDFPDVMKSRPSEKSGYLPRGAVIDLAAESALSAMAQLERQIRTREESKGAADVVFGFDVVHAEKQGNNVRIRSQQRVNVRADLARYQALRSGYWNNLFRAQRVANYLDDAAWFRGMDRVIALNSWDQTIGSATFRRDAQEAFENMEGIEEKSREELILRVVKTYLSRKLSSKYGLEWKSIKDDEKKKDYEEKKANLARDAFLAVRSRTGVDFIEYFTGTLCSVPHRLSEDEYLRLSRELLGHPVDTRTLTLLALSAASNRENSR